MRASRTCSLLLLFCLGACAGELPTPCRAVPSGEDRTQAAGWGERSWRDQVEDVRRGASELAPRLVLIGDSITQGWAGGGRQVGGAGAAARERWLEPLGPLLNAGISGDRTQHVLWRLGQGMLDGARPEHVVLLIGTNNLPHDRAPAIARGVEAILDELERRLPASRVLLLGPPPRGADPTEPLRREGRRLDALLEALARRRGVAWLPLAPLLLDDQGRPRPDRMAGDHVHLSAGGYEALGQVLAQRLRT